MKYALSIFVALLVITFAQPASARTIHSFRQSDAITAVAQFMYDVAEDIPGGARISDKKVKISDFSKCTDVSAQEVLSDLEKTIKRVLRFYPDEEIPFEQALVDFEDYLDHQSYKMCVFEKQSSLSSTKSIYYTDLANKIHLRIDNIALVVE